MFSCVLIYWKSHAENTKNCISETINLKSLRREHDPRPAYVGPASTLNIFSPACVHLQNLKLRPWMLRNKFTKGFLYELTVVCADCLLSPVAVTVVIMASSNINKLSMMIRSTSSRDQICQKLLSRLWNRGWSILFSLVLLGTTPSTPPPQTLFLEVGWEISRCCLVFIAITQQFCGQKIFTQLEQIFNPRWRILQKS